MDEVDTNLGSFKKDNEFNIKLNNKGDLLGNMNFKKLPKKYEEKLVKVVTENSELTDTLKIKMFNSTYNIIKLDNTEENNLVLVNENINFAYIYLYELYSLKIDFEAENSIILNEILSYDRIYIYIINTDKVLNELFKFNNIREKFMLGFANENKTLDLSVLSEHYKEYYNRLSKLFTNEYNFKNNTNLKMIFLIWIIIYHYHTMKII